MKTRILPAALVTSAFAAPAVAAPLDITNISGIWVNPVGGTSVTGENTPHITWGGGTTPSAYEFVAAADILAPAVNAPLLLGTFTHENNSIPIPNLSAVALDLSFDTNGIPSPVGALFDFDRNETPNTSGSSPVDDDIVTIGTREQVPVP